VFVQERVALLQKSSHFLFRPLIGENIGIMVEFDSVEQATSAFNALKEGGKIDMKLQETFWSKCFSSLTDKFDINWNISIGCPKE
jgi:PhnB protein